MTDIADIREEIVTEAEKNENERREKERQKILSAHAENARLERVKLHMEILPFLKGGKADTSTGRLFVDDVDVTSRFWVEDEYGGGDVWRRRATGRKRIVVYVCDLKYDRRSGRNYEADSRKSYPPRKDGTYKYHDIAQHLQRYADKQNAYYKLKTAQGENAPVVNALNAELKLDGYGPFKLEPSATLTKPVCVTISVKKYVTADHARDIYNTLAQLGLLGKE